MPTPEVFEGMNPRGTQTLIPCKDTKAQNGIKANTKLISESIWGESGKNKLQIASSVVSTTLNGVVITVNRNSEGEVESIKLNGTYNSSSYSNLTLQGLKAFSDKILGKSLKAVLLGSSDNNYIILQLYNYDGSNGQKSVGVNGNPTSFVWSNTAGTNYAINIQFLATAKDKVFDNLLLYPMFVDDKCLDLSFEPYRESVKGTLRDAEVTHGKNLNYYDVNSSSSQNVNYYINTDKTVSLSGTASSNSIKDLRTYTGAELKALGKDLILNGGNANAYLAICTSDYTMIAKSTGGDASFDTSTLTDDTTYYETIGILSGINTNGIVIKPMLRLATETDPTYEPYYVPLKDSMFPRSEQAVLGAKNLLPNNEITRTDVNGIDITVNNDLSITLNGTATTSFNIDIVDLKGRLKKGNYILSGCTIQGSISGFRGYINYQRGGVRTDVNDIGNGAGFTVYGDETTMSFSYLIPNGFTFNNVTLEPMIRLATDPDPTYAPYAKTNIELTKTTKTILLGTNSSYTFTFPDASANGNIHACFLALMSSTGGAEVNVLAGYRIGASTGNIKTLAGAATGSFDTTTGKFTITADGPQRTLTIIANAEILE